MPSWAIGWRSPSGGKALVRQQSATWWRMAFKPLILRAFSLGPLVQTVLRNASWKKSGFSLEAQFTQTLFKIKKGEFLDEWVYAIRRKES
jgi:hypothetical protein